MPGRAGQRQGLDRGLDPALKALCLGGLIILGLKYQPILFLRAPCYDPLYSTLMLALIVTLEDPFKGALI